MGDFTSRQAVFSPDAYLSTELGVNPSSGSFAFGHRPGKVDFFMDELMSQEMDISWRIAKLIGDCFCREAIYKGSANGLIPSLPFMPGMEEEVCVSHDNLIYADV